MLVAWMVGPWGAQLYALCHRSPFRGRGAYCLGCDIDWSHELTIQEQERSQAGAPLAPSCLLVCPQQGHLSSERLQTKNRGKRLDVLGTERGREAHSEVRKRRLPGPRVPCVREGAVGPAMSV